MIYDLSILSIPLPECVLNAEGLGDLSAASAYCDLFINDERTPKMLKERLEAEKERLGRKRENFPYTYAEAEQLLAVTYQNYRKGMLSTYINSDRVNTAAVDGVRKLEARIVENAGKRCEGLVERKAGEDPDLALRNLFITTLNKRKKIRARIQVEENLAIVGKEYEGKEIFVNLPVPKSIPGTIDNIEIISVSPTFRGIDDPEAPMRTAQFKAKIEKRPAEFSISFSYTITAEKTKLVNGKTDAKRDAEYLKEQLPHIRFTPYLKALTAEVTKGSRSNLQKAKKIYMWITMHVEYSFMEQYALIDCIAEYAAANLKGDCGVQAILFITMCRIAGIPARWNSGWYVTPSKIGNHDWAEFRLGDKWYPADCSFGGGGYRGGSELRHEHYFGALDIYRMIANTACCLPLTGKTAEAEDPTDNQAGEAECEGKRVKREAMHYTRRLTGFTVLEN